MENPGRYVLCVGQRLFVTLVSETGKRGTRACHQTELITPKASLTESVWLQNVRTEATSGPQKASLPHIYTISPPPIPLSSLSSSFNDYLNCSFFLSPFLLSLLQAKPIYGGWLCLAPEGTDFDNPMQRSRVRARK